MAVTRCACKREVLRGIPGEDLPLDVGRTKPAQFRQDNTCQPTVCRNCVAGGSLLPAYFPPWLAHESPLKFREEPKEEPGFMEDAGLLASAILRRSFGTSVSLDFDSSRLHFLAPWQFD